ncbi:MAG TPA: DUF3330 domain-containing protein [Nitrosomonas sp.]|nr:DUF3330 domain-containing protein [Nitrosomonas sp.]
MTKERRPIDPETIACEICMKEIPVSETISDEASDYVVHYCSVDCYAKWKEQNEKKLIHFSTGLIQLIRR